MGSTEPLMKMRICPVSCTINIRPATVAGIGDGSWLREAGGNLLQLNKGQGAVLLPQTVKSLKRPARENFRS